MLPQKIGVCPISISKFNNCSLIHRNIAQYENSQYSTSVVDKAT